MSTLVGEVPSSGSRAPALPEHEVGSSAWGLLTNAPAAAWAAGLAWAQIPVFAHNTRLGRTFFSLLKLTLESFQQERTAQRVVHGRRGRDRNTELSSASSADAKGKSGRGLVLLPGRGTQAG